MDSTRTTRRLDASLDQLREANVDLTQLGKHAARAYVDLYEKTVNRAADLHETLATHIPIESAAALISTGAALNRDLAKTHADAAREALA